MNQGPGVEGRDDAEPSDLEPDVLDADSVEDIEIEVSEDLPEATNGEPRPRISAGVALASFAGLTAGAAALGRVATRSGPGLWFRTQRKPPFQPPDWVFGPVWTALYALIAASGYRIWKAPPSQARSRALALWGAQLALNTAWTPLFFGARRKRAALIDLLALLGVVATYAQTARKIDRPAAAMMVPYLGWLGFAGVLNEEIIRRNRGWRRLLPG